MKLFPLLCLLALSLVQEGTSTHHETCECHEISELVNASVQQAATRLEYKLGIMIDTAISNINTTISNINTTVYTAISNTTDETALSNLESRLTSTIQGLLKPIQTQLDYHLPPPPSGETPGDPATSCNDLYDTLDASSGYYWIGEVGSAVRVYCNMSLTCGNLTGGWMRVANIDMTNTSQNCPSGLNLTYASPKRVCDITSFGCLSTDFHIEAQYSHICGRVIGYQRSAPNAFWQHSRGIEANYVNGVSLTHGQSPRQHIWTFAAARDESSSGASRFRCPCVNPNLYPTPTLPGFIGNDYFCDTALETIYSSIPDYYRSIFVSDPLWDGEGCGPTSTCCYDPKREVNPPWFVKTLSSPTSDDIEMRLCAIYNQRTPIEIVELYVQ